MQSSNLHNRVALSILKCVKPTPASVVGGFMTAAALLSMWVSNTATALMMLPIAESVISLYEKQSEDESKSRKNIFRECVPGEGESRDAKNFRQCLLLGLAFSCSIGGLATLM
eukprot:gb/GECG01016264.1/.p1 GENE.gb/GECG01016264.1/~~gb/GECG01016264.1/.p1  ORF type:complete len:113 (+),score=6.79 gb/GECG01016264.1/:1-339(+)